MRHVQALPPFICGRLFPASSPAAANRAIGASTTAEQSAYDGRRLSHRAQRRFFDLAGALKSAIIR